MKLAEYLVEVGSRGEISLILALSYMIRLMMDYFIILLPLLDAFLLEHKKSIKQETFNFLLNSEFMSL